MIEPDQKFVATPEKTPGDLKREEIAKELGSGWEFFMNCPRLSSGDPKGDSKQGETLVNILRLFTEMRIINDWRPNQLAVDEQGEILPNLEAFYIQRTPKQQMGMEIPQG